MNIQNYNLNEITKEEEFEDGCSDKNSKNSEAIDQMKIK
jgi:hypothetical protein